jgi:hypothetical protein
LLVLCASITSVYSQPPPPELPEGYYEEAQINDPPAIGPYDELFWTYDFSELECDDIRIWSFLTADFGGDIGAELVIYPIDVLNGSVNLDANTIASLAGHPGNGFLVTHLAFQLEINGVLNSTIILPGQTTNISTGLPPPCDCIGVFFHTASRKIYLYNGSCN